MERKCLVIGGCGMIGSQIVRDLVKNRFFVRVFDQRILDLEEKQSISNNIEYIEGNLSDIEKVKNALSGVTDVVHAAHTTVPASSTSNVVYDLESNIVPLIKLLNLLSSNDLIRHFVFLSSGGTIYGDPEPREPIKESHQTDPISSYGLTKLIAENYIVLLNKQVNYNSFILRVSNAYGRGQNLHVPQGVIGHFLSSILHDRPSVIYGDGSLVRDYIYVSDVSSAVIQCLLDNNSSGKTRTFNLGNGTGATLNEIVDLVQKITGRELMLNYKTQRSFDCQYNVLDISLVKDYFDWNPLVSLEEGMLNVWKWLKKGGEKDKDKLPAQK